MVSEANSRDIRSVSSESYAVDQITWLRTQLDRQIQVYKRRRRRDKRKAFALQMSTVALSATITVLLGLRVAGTLGARFSDAALTLGALVTVLAAAETFFDHRDLWLLRTGTLRRLESLDRRVGYYEAGLSHSPARSGDVDRYLAELDKILADDYSGWRTLHRTATHSEESSPGSTACRKPRLENSENDNLGSAVDTD